MSAKRMHLLKGEVGLKPGALLANGNWCRLRIGL
jgi:hypothetical protein